MVRAGRAAACAACLALLMISACGRKKVPSAVAPPRRQLKPNDTVARVDNNQIKPHAAPEPGGLRPVRVTVLEFGSPAGEADVWIEHFSPTSSWWHARTRGDGRATLLVPIAYTWFRVSASKAPNAIAAQFMRDLPPHAEPLDVTLNMTNQGVVITALLEAARPAMLSNVTVRIRPSNDSDWEDVSIARVPNTSRPRVVLPPIRRGLRGLRVEVMGPHIPASYSEYFDTLDGRDKTICVRLLEGARVYGTARFVDGRAAGSFILTGTRAGMREMERGAGAVHAVVQTDADGWYECASFAPDFYYVEASCEGARIFSTNIFVEETGTPMEVVFVPQPVMTIRGRVLEERTRQPVAGAAIIIEYAGITLTTDAAGAFTVRLPFDRQWVARVRVRHPRYAEVTHVVEYAAKEKEVEILLSDTAIVYGTVRYEDGAAAPGVWVGVHEFTRYGDAPDRSHVKMGTRPDANRNQFADVFHLSQPSDAQGAYVISNVAAPKSYYFGVWGATTKIVHPREYSPAVSVTPGAAVRSDLVVQRMPQVYVRVCTSWGTVMSPYRLQVTYASDGENRSAGSTGDAVTPGADGWTAVTSFLHIRDRDMRFGFRAMLPDGTTAETNDVRFAATGTYYITMTVATNTGRGLFGYVYDDQHEPIEGVQLEAWYETMMFDRVRTDAAGFFELPGSCARPGSTVTLHTRYHGRWYGTSVVVGVQPMIWELEHGRSLAGRVCIGDAGLPATNFAVGVDIYQPVGFQTPDGRFTLPVHNAGGDAGVLYAWVADYAPATKPYVLLPHGTTEVGEIVVAPWACAVRGRVVTERGAPLPAVVALHGSMAGFHVPDATTDARDGRYEFTRLPTGSYNIAAWRSGGTPRAESAPFSLAPGETLTVPDLVLELTNAVLVRVVFVHAHGAPAARLRVSHSETFTDVNGAIHDFVSIGRHANWTLSDDIYEYCAEAFDVTPSTHEVRVRVAPRDTIAGAATLDGVPLQWAAVELFHTELRHGCNGVINNGRFSWQAVPGKYHIVCAQERLVATAHLTAGDGNYIAFARGTAVLDVKLPERGVWYCQTRLIMEDAAYPFGSSHVVGDALFSLERLPEGTYEVEVAGDGFGAETNLSRRITLSRGERATLAF